MPPPPRALVVICLLLVAALTGPAARAHAATVETDGHQAHHRASARPAPPVAHVAVPRAGRHATSQRHAGALAHTAVPRAATAQHSAVDPRRADQWPLDGDGPMGVATAWRQTTGGDVTVAIIDSGIDLSHPDLAPNLWTNPGEIPANGLDDDGNGYVDDVHGYDVVDGDGDPQDRNGHGTHVAGIVGARGGNGIGVAGVAWHVRLMAVRVLDAHANGTTAGVADGIRYAVANGARIVNLSLAGAQPSDALEAAVLDAAAHGVLVVAAAGNAGMDLARAPAYPAAYAIADVIGVAATREDGRLAAVSDFGSGADLAAPGQDILSTALGGGYEWRTGTSMAAPEVTGALALLAAARPDLDAEGLRAALVTAARPTDVPVESGALDVGAALRRVVPADAWHDAPRPALTAVARAKAWQALVARVKARQAKTARATSARVRAARAKAARARSARARAARRRAARVRARTHARAVRTPRH